MLTSSVCWGFFFLFLFRMQCQGSLLPFAVPVSPVCTPSNPGLSCPLVSVTACDRKECGKIQQLNKEFRRLYFAYFATFILCFICYFYAYFAAKKCNVLVQHHRVGNLHRPHNTLSIFRVIYIMILEFVGISAISKSISRFINCCDTRPPQWLFFFC